MKKITITLLLFFASAWGAEDSALDRYIRTALNENLALQQKHISIRKARAALRQARGMYLPHLSIEARYSRAEGGRIIDIPIGDLMNPVYSSLNKLLEMPVFPTDLENESIPFLREREQETKLRLVQPVFQPGIYFNAKIKKQLELISQHEQCLYARELIAEVKKSYYNILKSDQAVKLLEETRELLKENLRVSQALRRAEKTTNADVYRAEAELANLEQTLADTRQTSEMARIYFNFLLNRSLDTAIVTNTFSDTLYPVESLDSIITHALNHREELKQLKTGANIAGYQANLHRSSFLPELTLVADYGVQGKEYSFTDKDDYWMASLIASWNLFNGFQDKNKIQKAKLKERETQLRVRELAAQIEMDVRRKYKAVQVAKLSIRAARLSEKSAQKAFTLIQEQYQQGIVPHIEYLDAQNRKTQAEMNTIIQTYEYQSRVAEMEQTASLIPVKAVIEKYEQTYTRID